MTYRQANYPAMSAQNYSAYCNAYVVCFVNDGFSISHDLWSYNYVVKAGIVFG
jgi:hypothetical protein